MEISKLTVGQIFFTITKGKMGNTTTNTVYVHRAVVTNITEDGKSFMASWNGNSASKYWKVPPNWKTKKPYLVDSMNGYRSRLATKDEKTTGKITEHHDYFLVEEK